MLKSIDILIGLSVVMLMVSLVVTVLTGIVNHLLQRRGKHLLDGIAGLLRQIHPTLPAAVSREIAKAVLTHPLIRSAGEQLGSVIHREELTALLSELAAGEVPPEIKDSLSAEAKTQLCDLLKANGIDDPAQRMESVRSVALALERSHPELSNQARMTMAFLQEAGSHFLGKLHGWFDQTMDRVSDRFTNSTRVVTFLASLAVALGIQLDAAALVRRLNTDQTLRQELVQKAAEQNKIDLQSLAPPGPDPSEASKAKARENLEYLSSVDIVQMPASVADWWAGWGKDWNTAAMKLLGIFLTTILLSLGAPFWYNALKNLLRLRSLMAQKDDDQRATRQQTTSGD